ncbi:hypothetical protein LJY25_14105 [Hymenobacter sp. BT175]|uniref:hypothetical protein n=1 Tax=Hymenobacter translucens TaxID=2886507 RepID=UPI001D0E942C|nr:hypothetical protein [Hymenobacter translucens]MCC2547586.1 hypothetical protein [Hymenobacter translucens]
MKAAFLAAALLFFLPKSGFGQGAATGGDYTPEQRQQIRRACPHGTRDLQQASFYEDGTVAVLTYYQQKNKVSRPYKYRQYTFYADGAPCSRIRISSSGTQKARTWNQSGQLTEKRKATMAAQGTVIETARRFAYQDGRLASIRITKERQACYVIDVLESKTIELTSRGRVVTTHKSRENQLSSTSAEAQN